MSKDPAFLMYSNDFLTGVAELTMEERGQFITLLCLQHQKGAVSEKLMRLQCHGIPSADVLNKFRIDKNGNYFNERVESEREKRKKHSEKQRANAMARWDKKKNNNNKTSLNKHTNGNAMAMPLEDVNVNENEIDIEVINEIEIYPTFEDFWNLYDKKSGNKNIIKKKFNKLPQKIKNQIMDYLPEYIESTPNKTYRKNPQTFLNNKGWEDEIINNGNTKNNTEPNYGRLESILNSSNF